MIKSYKFFCSLLLFSNLAYSNEVYQSVRIYNPTTEVIEFIGQLGIPLDHVTGKKGIFLDLIITEDETIKLLSRGIALEILIDDLTSHYKSRNRFATNRDFPLGSMQGNYTWDELNARFDELQLLYPDIISERVIIGQSIEGRDIWAFKVSDNPNEDEDEPEVLYTSLTHAREPLSMMNLIYFVQLIAEQYNLDPELDFLVNNREMWFIPVVNPDGYVYNESIEPGGGGMHRKNRLDTNCGDGTNRGVDLNRNYGYGWGADDTGSSPNPCSTTYRGESEFSEPETQAVRDFILNQQFKNVLHYHSYSNVYIHAFGDGSLPEEPDFSTLTEIAQEMAMYNGYPVGTGFATIGYTVNGDAVDWTYGDQDIISYVPEVGSSSQGFWPSEDDVVGLCLDQVYANKIFAYVAGADIIVSDYEFSEEDIIQGETIDIEIVIQNRGLSNSFGDIEISINALNDYISIDTESYTMSEMDARDSDDFSFSIEVSEDAPLGSASGVIVSLDSESSFSRNDTIQFVIGQRQTFFVDGFENELANWYLDGDWGLTDDAASGSYALSDSPDGEYQEAQESIAEFTHIINLQYVTSPMVEFTAKWDIESNWDFVRFQAFVEDSSWVSLEGEYTEFGTGQPAQPFGEPGYDGTQNEWINESISLDSFSGSSITGFRFIQTSDNFVEGDGFTFDDFSISGFPTGIMGDYNLDMSVDIFDMLEIADVLIFGSEPTESQLFFCDLNGSGILDVMDLIALSNIILGL
ncbi:MAG: M14 family zinc carboxypeptidase [Candidatus Neomarinimicrobiota bacterium]